MKKQRLLLISCLIFLCPALRAQNHSITGRITDAKTGEKMQGVSITVDNQKQGTVTKADGTYSINVADGSQVLNFSYVGYTLRSVPINGKAVVDVALEPQ